LRYRWASDLFQALGLFDAYRAPWFLALLAVLLVSVVACTIQRLPRLWRSVVEPRVVTQPEAFFQAKAGFRCCAEWPVSSSQAGLAAAEAVLSSEQAPSHLRVEQDEVAGCVGVYAERGRWARLGTLVSHAAALLLLAAVLSRPALGWQEAGVTLLPGQVYPVGHGYGLAVRSGDLVVDPEPSDVGVGPGEAAEAGPVRSFQVPLAVLVNSAAVLTETVRLNDPLVYHGLAFHLQSYGPAVQVVTPEGIFALSYYTVWQVSHDPTVGWAVGSAIVLLGGMVVSLWVPRRRLWLRIDGQTARVVGDGISAAEFEVLAATLAGACRPKAESHG
jgi:cytochrome c biogenesis protein